MAVLNNGESTISILLGNGDGTLKAAIKSQSGGEPFYLTTGDFNRDGKLDLVASSANAQFISVLLGNGDGTFATPVTYPAGFNPYTILAADFNGDSNLILP